MQFIRKHLLPIAGIGLAAVIVAAVLVLRQIGSAYGRGIKVFEGVEQHETPALAKNAKIRKIRITKSATGECIEVTPDGAVRVYQTCGGNLEDTFRSTDSRSVQNLIRLVTEKGTKTYTPGATEVVVELEDGTTTTVYIPPDPGGGGGGPGIDDIIDDIIDEGQEPTGTPGTTTAPFATPTFAPTLPAGPTPTSNPFATPTPTPEEEKPFTCDFNDTGGTGTKPYRVSNVVCSTEPVPGQ